MASQNVAGHVDGLPGRIHGSEINGGPITIVDTSPFGLNFGDEVIALARLCIGSLVMSTLSISKDPLVHFVIPTIM